jgi:hypothetical protein
MTTKATAATRAAEDVALWVSAESELRVVYNKTSADELAGWGYDAKTRRRLLTEKVDRSLRLPFLKGLHGQTVTLVDYLLMVTSHMDSNYVSGDDVTLTLSPSHFEAIVKIYLSIGENDQETFFVKHFPLAPVVDPDRIRTDISVYGTFLAAIAARTDDPFAEGLKQHPRKRGAT